MTHLPRLRFGLVGRLRKRRPTGRYRYVRWRWHLLFGLVDRIGEALRALLSLFAVNPIDRDRPPNQIRSILLVQLDHLGDAVITAAILPALRKHYPVARIEVLAAPWNREIFESCGEVDVVHVSGVNRFAPGWRPHWLLAQCWWGLRLRRRRFELGIDVRGEMPLAAILWLAGVKRRVGWDCGGGGFLLTDSAKFVPARPEIESRLALFKLIGIDAPADLLEKTPWFTPPAAARSSISDRLDRCDSADGPLIVLHVGAGTPAKRWPAAYWQELLGRIIVEYGARVILVGGRNERTLADEVIDGKPWPGMSDWTGQLVVAETAALIEQADLFIGADSGPAHLAAAVGTPAIVLFSGTNRVRQWRPWGRVVSVAKHQVPCSPCHLRRCPMSNHPCMSGISPEAVMVRVADVLGDDGPMEQEVRSQKSEVGILEGKVGLASRPGCASPSPSLHSSDF